MRLAHARIRNFRTATDVAFSVRGKCALIGPNNAGKTNLLRALHMFFCQHSATMTNQRLRYDRRRDFPHSVEGGRTTISIVFECEHNEVDGYILERYNRIRQLLQLPISNSSPSQAINILLTFSENGTAAFQIFPNSKRPARSASALELDHEIELLFDELFSNLAVHYIQSDKRFTEIYEDMVLPSVKLELDANLSEMYHTVKQSINSVNAEINQYLMDIGLAGFTIRLAAPDHIADFIRDIDFRLEDEIEGDLQSKGMGIQALAVTASMLWLQRFYQKNKRSVIWLIEEPESFLHPSLISAQSRILDKLADSSTVIYATHALGFVPADASRIVGVRKEGRETRVSEFKTSYEATGSLRKSLGVRFSDFFNLQDRTVAVEGPSDKRYLEWFLKLYSTSIAPREREWPLLRTSSLVDYGGVKNLQSFIQATYDYIRRESIYVALFDSDDAGSQARQALQRFFQNKDIGFEANRDFVSVRRGYAIEGLFSDEILKRVYAGHPKVFEGFSVDSEGAVEPFRISDDAKADAFKLLTAEGEAESGFEWARRFITLCQAIETALAAQRVRLARSAA